MLKHKGKVTIGENVELATENCCSNFAIIPVYLSQKCQQDAKLTPGLKVHFHPKTSLERSTIEINGTDT